MRAPALLDLPDGRRLAYDEVGDRDGLPVVYLHGTPDSRLARHPDDGLATACGVRLLAVDRPGTGDSDPAPQSTLTSLAGDLEVLLDDRRIGQAALLGWSAGGLFALAAASALGARIAALGLVAPVPPVEAYEDAAVLGALGPSRRHFVELAGELRPQELGEELAPYLVPVPLTEDLALEHVLEGAGDHGRADLAGVPGGAEQLARALAASVQQGTAALAHDLALQLERGLALGPIRARVRSWHGTEDPMSPPVVGRWLATHLPDTVVEVVPGGSHQLLLARWQEILLGLVADAAERA